MSGAADRLYNLLPAVYRRRDAAQGEPLRALLSLIEGQYEALDQDITELYENWFIETCAEWVVPYIGDLLGVRPLRTYNPAAFSQRAYVAGTLGYRRRKGTASVIERLAADVTGWPARAVEFFELLAVTQYLNRLRLKSPATSDLRNTGALELLGGPFESTAHTVEVRRIASGRGRYNIPNVGIYLWRLQDYRIGPVALNKDMRIDFGKPARQSDARAAADPGDGRYAFDPLGIDAPLFNSPETKEGDARTAEINVPACLRRRALHDELEALRQAKVDGLPAPLPAYFGDNPVFQVFVDGVCVPVEQIEIRNIADVSPADWARPAAAKSYTPSAGGSPVKLPLALAVDPVRGRIAFPTGVTPHAVEVGYVYGFSSDVGAGPYNRTAWLTDESTGPGPLHNPLRWQGAVSKELPADGQRVFATLAEAVAAWNARPERSDGVIVITDCRRYAENLDIRVKEGGRLLIVAADWPALRVTGGERSLDIDPNGFRPHLLGDLMLTGEAHGDGAEPGRVYLDGLLIEGRVVVRAGSLGALSLSHSTVVPGGTLRADANPGLEVSLYRSICGPVSLDESVAALKVAESIVTSGAAGSNKALAIAAAGASLQIESATVFGRTRGRAIEASSSIFMGSLQSERRQTGCVRFCYVPADSQTPRRYRCQPDLALASVPEAEHAAVRARLTPQFTSVAFGQPAYAQLGARCAGGITAGAADESEMGVFRHLQQPQRRANLRQVLDEYLRFGMEAGTIEVT